MYNEDVWIKASLAILISVLPPWLSTPSICQNLSIHNKDILWSIEAHKKGRVVKSFLWKSWKHDTVWVRFKGKQSRNVATVGYTSGSQIGQKIRVNIFLLSNWLWGKTVVIGDFHYSSMRTFCGKQIFGSILNLIGGPVTRPNSYQQRRTY